MAADLADRVAALPGMPAVLPALDGLAPTYLVGGAVRDLLRGERATDLDLAVEGDAGAVAGALAARLDGSSVAHERFGTATVRAPAASLDLASTRRERYAVPGALPDVEPAGIEEDLGRRDFTVNAMAVGLNGDEAGRLRDPAGGSGDLSAAAIRVLHERSFLDDPTRLLRALRYEARLGFALDPMTAQLFVEATRGGAVQTVSGARVRDELMDLLSEHEAPAAVARMRDLGLARALHPSLRADPDVVAGAALASMETGADRALAGLAALCSGAPEEAAAFVARLSLPAPSRDAALRAARRGPVLASALRGERRDSELHLLLSPEPPESLALALALGAPAAPVLRFVSNLRGVRLEITGGDLLAAGVAQSPALGRALEGTLRRKLDGEIAGRDEELRTAVDLARGAR